jgi:hypothetical protein
LEFPLGREARCRGEQDGVDVVSIADQAAAYLLDRANRDEAGHQLLVVEPVGIQALGGGDLTEVGHRPVAMKRRARLRHRLLSATGRAVVHCNAQHEGPVRASPGQRIALGERGHKGLSQPSRRVDDVEDDSVADLGGLPSQGGPGRGEMNGYLVPGGSARSDP